MIKYSDKYYYDTPEKPIYEQVADIIRKDILEGNIPVGKQLLPESKLAQNFNVSLVTIQRTLKSLSQENLLERSRKKGTFVSQEALRLLNHKTIGLIMPTLGAELTLSQSPVNYHIFDGIQKFCYEHSWNIQIMHNKFHSFSWEQFAQSHIAGVIVVLPNRSTYELIAELKKRKIPFVCVNLHSDEVNKDVNFVNVDCYGAAIDAVKYFYGQGKKKIAVADTWEMRDDIHQFHIVEGYRQAVKTLGIKESIITHDKDMELPFDLLPDFFKSNLLKIKKHDAILLTDPHLEIPLLSVLHDNNIKIPEDISIASIFNWKKTENEIDSYHSNFQDIGYQSICLLDEIFNDKDKKLRQRKIKPQLITRLSV